ncbi:MAG: hypothetical protein GY774_22280 [Planctomycetes bacterium]|nr:hypothetical protein [Planctomycetota bacterium]|tara:strand:- start:397 stop:684 length:288 start_codon:yes stop_codon:yes gene_type:complete
MNNETKNRFLNNLNQETCKETRTALTRNFLAQADDDTKQRFALNWHIPHSLFNVASSMFGGSNIQNICWYTIYKQGIGCFTSGAIVGTPADFKPI